MNRAQELCAARLRGLIALSSLLPFVLLFLSGRSLAPTRLRLADSFTGRFAGALIGPRVLRW